MEGQIRKFSFKDSVFLNSGHMCGNMHLDMPVEDFRNMVHRNLRHMINNPRANPSYKSLRVVYEKDASYSYDMSDDFYEKHCVGRIFTIEDDETYGGMTPFFVTKDMGMHSLPWLIVLSNTAAKFTIIWEHAVIDGVSGHIVCNTLIDRPMPSYPVTQLSPVSIDGSVGAMYSPHTRYVAPLSVGYIH